MPSDQDRREPSVPENRFLDSFCRAHPDDPVLWGVAPELYAMHRLPGLATHKPHRRFAPTFIRTQRVASALYAGVRPAGATARYYLGDQVLFLEVSTNHGRVLRPIAARATAQVERLEVRPDPITVWKDMRAAGQLARSFMDAARFEGIRLPYRANELTRKFMSIPLHSAYATALIETHQPRAVVVASNHGKPTRALLRAARKRGIPSIYFPHAPLNADPRFRDLPSDYAGLRGVAEREWHLDAGHDGSRIGIIGDPSLPAVDLAPIEPSSPLVFAPSSYEPEVLSRTVDVIRAGTDERVVVSPHPGQDPESVRRLCPRTWEIHEQRTFELLGRGARAVIQHSSGTGLEALLLGLPTVDLSVGRPAPNYPFLDSRFVRFARTPDELGLALESAVSEGSSQRRRRELHEWGRRWTSEWGERAADLGWELVGDAIRRGATSEPIWDAWQEIAAYPDALVAGAGGGQVQP